MTGYGGNFPDEFFGGSKIDFNKTPPEVSYYYQPADFGFKESAVIASKDGELILYSDGCSIANREHETMENGDSINIGSFFLSNCGQSIGYPARQAMVALPDPNDSSGYFLVHARKIVDPIIVGELMVSTVRFDSAHPSGRVVEKNFPISPIDTFAEQLTAVRHGNGRDWWIVQPHNQGNEIWSILLSPQGFSPPKSQRIGHEQSEKYWAGQTGFSPDGRKFIRANPFNGIDIFNFDRCTGEFSNPVYIPITGDTVFSCGVAVSPNNRFLFVAQSRVLVQYDLTALDIEATRAVVSFLPEQGPGKPFYFMLMLAPDGKIYGVAGTTMFYHIIHDPNQKGVACNVQPSGLELPTYCGFSIPNMVHYRLLDLPGSPCDSLGINAPVGAQILNDTENEPSTSPNPVSDAWNLYFAHPPERDSELRFFDVGGRLVFSEKIRAETTVGQVSLGALPNGLFVWQLSQKGVLLKTGRVVKVE